jgi:AraC-like DNA-binding protein
MTTPAPKAPPEVLPHFGFNSGEMSPADNLAAWQEAASTLFDVDTRGPARFRADLDTYAMGAVLFGRSRCGAQRFTRSADTIARSGVDHIIIQHYMEGGFDGVAGGRDVVMRAGEICVFDLGQTISTSATDFDCLTFIVPRAVMQRHVARPENLHGLVLPRESMLSQILARHFLALFEFAPRMTFDECEAVIDGTLSLIAACLRGAAEERDASETGVAGLSPLKIRDHIDANLARADLTVESIAATFGVSRATLYRLFEPFGGIADHIRNKRLHHAFFELTSFANQGKRVGEIARRWQFSSEAAFSRAFRAAYGITPSAAREASLLGWQRMNASLADTPDHSVLSRWMQGISAEAGQQQRRERENEGGGAS